MISMIAAVAKNRAIGYQNKLLYWLPNDLKRFKQLTTGHTIIMGRRTFESLPKGALPNRRNIVLTRHVENNVENSDSRFPDCDVYTSLEEALQHCSPDEDIYIIGGASVYKQALPYADRLCLTEIDDTPMEADAFFPAYDNWREVWREEHETDERHHYRYAFVDYLPAVEATTEEK
ncbi:MAG: dihydrofolate reductase [Prevotella sp.]|nr:dihydrofolate reductase [Prevotella sp.]